MIRPQDINLMDSIPMSLTYPETRSPTTVAHSTDVMVQRWQTADTESEDNRNHDSRQ